MKITMCGSISFAKDILRVRDELVSQGHEVLMPHSVENLDVKTSEDADSFKAQRQNYMDIKPELIKGHFDKIKNSDAILVINMKKHGIKNYVGGNTLAEILFALYHDKKVFFLNPIPTDERLRFMIDEIESVKPVVINSDLSLIR